MQEEESARVRHLSLDLRRFKLRMRYWYGVKGHLGNHPVKLILRECWEYECREITSFGWLVRKEVDKLEPKNHEIAPSVALPAIPPWLFHNPVIDLRVAKLLSNLGKNVSIELIVQQYITREYDDALQVFTDGSKDPESERAAAAVYIPAFEKKIAKRLSDQVSVFATELLAIILALQWIEEVEPERTVICSDSMAALTSLRSGKSESRQDLILEILQSLFRIRQLRVEVNFLWVPAHVGVGGNEMVDVLAKNALNHSLIDIKVALSRAEFKAVISSKVGRRWQEVWNSGANGRHLFLIQETVGTERKRLGNRRKDVIVTRLRIGHAALNSDLFRIDLISYPPCPHPVPPAAIPPLCFHSKQLQPHLSLHCYQLTDNTQHT
ncbi:uncharacterized protein LOC124403146 [Silurus meridionalis]|nr:uncharacterized protein LOC124403146 [Silurus meridionalis]